MKTPPVKAARTVKMSFLVCMMVSGGMDYLGDLLDCYGRLRQVLWGFTSFFGTVPCPPRLSGKVKGLSLFVSCSRYLPMPVGVEGASPNTCRIFALAALDLTRNSGGYPCLSAEVKRKAIGDE